MTVWLPQTTELLLAWLLRLTFPQIRNVREQVPCGTSVLPEATIYRRSKTQTGHLLPALVNQKTWLVSDSTVNRVSQSDRSILQSARALAWWAAKWEQMHVTRRRKRVKATATAPLLPPTPSTPHATEAVDTSPMLPCSTLSFGNPPKH